MNSTEYIFILILLISVSLYAILILGFTIGWMRIRKMVVPSRGCTEISVIVPARNEEQDIGTLLGRLLDQEYPSNYYEIIVVNDHSEDNTRNEILKHNGGGQRIKLLDQKEGYHGKKAAIDLGIQHATGRLIACIDADCHPGKSWLQMLAGYYDNGRYKMIVGPVAIEHPRGFIGHFQALEFLSLVGSGAGAIGVGMPVMCNGANLAYEKNAFLEVGGFEGNKHIPGGDDIFLLEKFSRFYTPKKIGFIKDRKAIVYTKATNNLIGFLNQRIRWVAKSPAYRDLYIITTAMIVLLFNLVLFASLFGAIYSHYILNAFLGALLLKTIIDFPLLWQISRFARQHKLMLWYLPFQLIYYGFISVIGIAGNLLSYKWKGR
jgi:cellulose synthase/poly-beta-1,6-N-acetylglucosamine synthase-like glycosyltransferase